MKSVLWLYCLSNRNKPLRQGLGSVLKKHPKQKEEKDFFFFHNRSPVNTLSKSSGDKAKEVKKINTNTLNTLIENSKFKDDKIDFLSIDVEGHEYFEVDYLSQNVIYTSVINTNSDSSRVPNIMKPVIAPRRFVVINERNQTILQFFLPSFYAVAYFLRFLSMSAPSSVSYLRHSHLYHVQLHKQGMTIVFQI